MELEKRSISAKGSFINGHKVLPRTEKPYSIDFTTVVILVSVVLLILSVLFYALSSGIAVSGTHQNQSQNKEAASPSKGIAAAGAVDVHPIYAALDEPIPFALHFTFTGNASTTYRMGAWIYGGNTSANYSQIWTNGNFSNTSAPWGWHNQSYYTYFITNETGQYSHWIVLRTTGTIPEPTYDYVLRVRFYGWNGTNWVTINTVEFKNSTGAFKLLNVTQSGSGSIETGGWIWGYVNSSTKASLDNRVVVVKNSGGNILGTTFTEINGVDEGYDTFGSGYYKVAVKDGTDYTMEVWYDLEPRGSMSGVSVTPNQGTHVDITADPAPEGVTAIVLMAALIPAIFLYTKREKRGKN